MYEGRYAQATEYAGGWELFQNVSRDCIFIRKKLKMTVLPEKFNLTVKNQINYFFLLKLQNITIFQYPHQNTETIATCRRRRMEPDQVPRSSRCRVLRRTWWPSWTPRSLVSSRVSASPWIAGLSNAKSRTLYSVFYGKLQSFSELYHFHTKNSKISNLVVQMLTISKISSYWYKIELFRWFFRRNTDLFFDIFDQFILRSFNSTWKLSK